MQFKDICRDEQLFKECVAPIANACVYKGAPPVKTVAPRLDGQSVSCDGHENVQADLLEVEPQMNHAKTFVVPDKESLSQPHYIKIIKSNSYCCHPRHAPLTTTF